jgi:hypothetical protein
MHDITQEDIGLSMPPKGAADFYLIGGGRSKFEQEGREMSISGCGRLKRITEIAIPPTTGRANSAKKDSRTPSESVSTTGSKPDKRLMQKMTRMILPRREGEQLIILYMSQSLAK